MKIGIAKETQNGEKRVLVLPEGVRRMVEEGHQVLVEKDAGYDLGVFDRDYHEAGAETTTDRSEVFGNTDLLAKLKAPTEAEFKFLDRNILFSMLHHAQNPQNVHHLGERDAKAVEIESVFNGAGERLVDATDITGEMGVLYAVQHLNVVPQEAEALILGYGRVGSGAIAMCNKLGINSKILRREEYAHIEHFLNGKNLLINAISWPKEAREQKRYVVTRDMLGLMGDRGVILDLSVDFPNPIETCRATSIKNPFYVEEGKVHIGIYGYPGLVPVSSSRRYSGQVTPLIIEIANNGGLEGLAQQGELGENISRAVVDPEKLNWRDYHPEEIEVSLTE